MENQPNDLCYYHWHNTDYRLANFDKPIMDILYKSGYTCKMIESFLRFKVNENV